MERRAGLWYAEQVWEAFGWRSHFYLTARLRALAPACGRESWGEGFLQHPELCSLGGGVCLWPRFSEPDPSHTLEERVVHWYFSQLDSNSSNDINKREMKPFKRYVKKKAKPKKCARRFTDYCDLNKDKVISLPELKGCLGVSKEGECLPW